MFVHHVRVRYHECDPQSVVFNANYFAYFDMSITELWRAAFGSYGAMHERGVDLVVAEERARFLGAARFDEELALRIGIERLGNSSVTARHEIRRADELLVEGTTVHVFVDAQTLRRTPIPDWARDGLQPWTT
jgi:acyl-CoA thioester hydrolase